MTAAHAIKDQGRTLVEGVAPSSPAAIATGGFVLEDVSFKASGRTLLGPLSLQLEDGRIHALIGPNGSGKSTLLKLIARQQQASGGKVRLSGRLLSDFGDRDFARYVAYMPQFTPPAEGMTVRELVAMGRFPWHGALGRFGETDRTKVDEALEGAGLEDLASRLADSLSGGERQRAWLAMMLAQDTRWLLLDEPTSALDVAHQVDMLALVARLARDRRLGVVLVLHDVNMAARFCDQIIALGHGKVVARGAPAAIMEPGTLKRIYGVDMDVLAHPRTGGPISYVV